MTDQSVTEAPALDHALALRLVAGYVSLYAFGYLAKPMFSLAALWPAHAVSFAAFVLLPARRWPWAALAICAIELIEVPLLERIAGDPASGFLSTFGFAIANILTGAGAASLSRLLGLFGTIGRPRLTISPLWIVALFAGAAPGSICGAAMQAHTTAQIAVPGDFGLWDLASALSIATFAPCVFGLARGFAEDASASANAWEGWCVCALMIALFGWFAFVAWPAADDLVQPMLFAVPLAWLALRFSHRATSVAVAVVASGVVVLAGHRTLPTMLPAGLIWWRNIVISIDIFLLIGCGGALLVNLMMLKQRALLEELASEHEQLRQYARALDFAEESARRSTAADLHDGIGQVLAGQSMTLAAMRVQGNPTKLAALVEEAVEASREAQEGLRLMIQDLSPPELEHASLEETLQWLAELFKSRFRFAVSYRILGGTDLGRDRIRLIYRCVRELLMNAYKHSKQQAAEAEIEVRENAVYIAVIDEGIGFDSNAERSLSGRRFGLAQLKERVRAAGGTFALESVVGEGCRVTVRLPR